MSDQSNKGEVEISLGDQHIRLSGSEEFISSELSNILEEVTLHSNSSRSISTNGADEEQGSSNNSEAPDSGEDGSRSGLEKVAERINAEVDDLKTHFYLEGDNVHIHDPREIEPRMALIGYCTIREVLYNETYHDYNGTRDTIVDQEKVDVGEWGSDFIWRAREDGIIKDKPDTQKQSRKPFSITPKGREKFVNWLNEDD